MQVECMFVYVWACSHVQIGLWMGASRIRLVVFYIGLTVNKCHRETNNQPKPTIVNLQCCQNHRPPLLTKGLKKMLLSHTVCFESHTILVLLLLAHQVCISLRLKIVPNKCIIYSCLSKLFMDITGPLKKKKLYICDPFLKMYAFSSNKSVWGI